MAIRPPQQRVRATAEEFLARLGPGPVRYADATACGLSDARLRTAVAAGLLVRPRYGLIAVAPDVPAPAGLAAALSAPPSWQAPVLPALAGSAAALSAPPSWQAPIAPVSATSPDPVTLRLAVSGPVGSYDDIARQLRAAHLAILEQVSLRLAPTALVAHDSSAILEGLLRPSAAPPAYAEFIVPGQPDYVGDGFRVRGSGVPYEQRVTLSGLRATSLERTAVDLARGRPLPAALVPLDSAMRILIRRRTNLSEKALRRVVHEAALVEWARGEIARALRRLPAWPGTVAVRTALAVADPAAESAPESRSRGWILAAGLPAPECGVPLVVSSGRTYWADLLWRGRRCIGEIDGWAKYGGTFGAVGDALRAEKARQHELEDAGWRVIRWTSTDDRQVVLHRIRQSLTLTS